MLGLIGRLLSLLAGGKTEASVFCRHLMWVVVLLAAAAASVAQQTASDDAKLAAPPDCGSVVIIKCERPESTREGAASPTQQSRRAELRRQNSQVQQLDGVVIEDNAIRRRSVEDTIGNAFPSLRPRDGDYTFATGEGAQCTCSNNCPPWPLPCCVCSGQMNRYRSTPGSSPLN